jgi:hypothetical protein
MLNIICSMLFFLLSFQCLGADISNNFHRINPKNNTFQVLFKEYSKDEITIKLLPMAHFAEKSFYDRIEKEFTGKTVIYELSGGDWASQKQIFSVLAKGRHLADSLGPAYKTAFEFCQNLANPYFHCAKKYGVTTQYDLNYDSAKLLILADTVNQEKLNSPTTEMKELFENSEKFKNEYFILPAKDLVSKGKIKHADEEHDLVQNLADYLQNLFFIKVNSLPLKIEEFITQGFENDKLMLTEQNSFYITMVVARNEIVFNKIKETVESGGSPKEIIIPYGAGHMPMIEKFLLSIGFQPKPDGEEWVKVLSLN